MSLALGELAVRFGCALRGDPDRRVDHIAPLGAADPTALSFLANARLSAQLPATRAGAVVLAPASAELCPVPALISSDPHPLFARIAVLLHPAPPPVPGIHASAIVDTTAEVHPSAEIGAYCVVGVHARIGPRCQVGPGCMLGGHVQLGEDTRLMANVTLAHGVRIGRRVLIHPGAVIGADGFGFAREQGRWLKVPQIGAVLVGDDAEIGANTTVDRGAMQDTVIGEGVKLDNLIQIGHNVQIGAHTAIAGCTGVGGSTRIGERCMIGGGVGITGHIEICDDVVIAGRTTVSGSIRQPGAYASLWSAEPLRQWKRIVARLKLLAQREGAHAHSNREAQETDDE
ncbi:MAG TPA: UDP-3-O-(3-hydroxymyristoyl)glucosamine N-acyltransferase [Steroidobacteraceae bacterium]|jgi:UDP-3-O-[3-hydroxymyristoyl] glucosamine N-acyltransferase|nr:UDP-3-O-(3-hydroxymyristoyl)glucosamine N-acyltransferase [Steroidobacteraceae bacterium]